MKRNLGKTDRLLRLLLAVVLLTLVPETDRGMAFSGQLLVVVIGLLATAGWGFCPLYRMLNLSTYHPGRNRRKATGGFF